MPVKQQLFLLLSTIYLFCPLSSKVPTILVKYENQKSSYRMTSRLLWQWPFFKTFDDSLFREHLLPAGEITYRSDPQKTVSAARLSDLVTTLINEVREKKKTFTHFTVLRNYTFNGDLVAGSMTLKFNDYPFVVKLFIESPYSFVHPCKKGWWLESYLMHVNAGGINHYLAGFTRISNLKHIKEKLEQSPYWNSKVDVPRKWFWTPPDSPWLEITGYHFPGVKKQEIKIPSIYCIIADAIEPEFVLSANSWKDWFNLDKEDLARLQEVGELSLALCNYLDFCVDPGLDNFVIERHTKKLVIIDTEHYPSLAGLTRKPQGKKGHLGLTCFILFNCLRNVTLGPKSDSGQPFDAEHFLGQSVIRNV